MKKGKLSDVEKHQLKVIGKAIRQWQLVHPKVTQKKLASMIGVSPSHLSHILNPDMENPKQTLLGTEALSKVLKITGTDPRRLFPDNQIIEKDNKIEEKIVKKIEELSLEALVNQREAQHESDKFFYKSRIDTLIDVKRLIIEIAA